MNPNPKHTHCQVAQADPQSKTWQRVCFSNPRKEKFKKMPHRTGGHGK